MYATCTSSKMHLICPPKFCISIVFNFSWDGKCHHCCGFIINRTFRPNKYLSKMVWYLIGVYIINRTLCGRLEIRNFSSRVEKNISRVSAANE